MKKLLLLLTTFTTLTAAQLPSTTACRDEWHAAKNNPHSSISEQWDRVEGSKKHDVVHTLNALFWRLELSKLLAGLPEGEKERWSLEFIQLMAAADTSIATGDAMVQKTPYAPPFYYIAPREELPTLYTIAEKMAQEFKVSHPLVAIADHPRMGTAWVAAGNGKLSLLVVGSALLDQVDDQGLEGVLAHEFAHVERNHPMQKAMLPVLLALLLFLLCAFLVWRFALYLGLVENSINGFFILLSFTVVCELFALIPHVVKVFQPVHSRYIERDADRRACEVHTPAAAQLHRAFNAMKKEFDNAIARRDAGYNKARNMVKDDEALAEHVKKTLGSYIDGLERKAQTATAEKHGWHPSLAERMTTLEKKYGINVDSHVTS